MKLFLSPEAQDSIRNIQVHIAADNIMAAARVADEIRRTVEMLRLYPLIGTTYRDNIRRIVISRYPYSIYYRVEDKRQIVEIITVRHDYQKPPIFDTNPT